MLIAPMTARTAHLSGGGRIGYASYGDPQGRPLLFFHGWPGSRLQGTMVDAEAKRNSWNVVSPDRPGIGLTTCPEPFTLTGWPQRVEQLLDALGWERCDLLAISGGTPAALACAAFIPSRIRAIGICCGAVSLAEAPSLNGLFPLFRSLLELDGRIPFLSPTLLRAMQVYFRLLPPSVAMQPNRLLLRGADRRLFADPEVRRSIAQSLREAYRQGPHGVLRDGRAIAVPWGFDWRNAARRRPMCFWHGDEDRTIPLEMARWSIGEMKQTNRLKVFPGEGHFSLPIARAESLLDDLARCEA